MPKTTLLYFLLFLSVISCFAQTSATNTNKNTLSSSKAEAILNQTAKFEIEVEGGPGILFLHGNNSITPYAKNAVGGMCGLFWQYNFKKVVSIKSGIEYTRKGENQGVQRNDIDYHGANPTTTHDNFDYLNFPVLLKASFGKRAKFFINAGPFFGLLLAQNTWIKDASGTWIKTTGTDRYKPFDAGLTFGLGASLPFRIKAQKLAFVCEARNSTGFYDIAKLPVALSSRRVQTNTINFLLGITLQIGHRLE